MGTIGVYMYEYIYVRNDILFPQHVSRFTSIVVTLYPFMPLIYHNFYHSNTPLEGRLM